MSKTQIFILILGFFYIELKTLSFVYNSEVSGQGIFTVKPLIKVPSIGVSMLNKARVLIVEDEKIIGSDIKEILEGNGYDVPMIVGTGFEAVQAERLLKPDLVFMDVTLKGELSGFDTAEIIHAQTDTPVVFISGQISDKSFDLAKRSGYYGFVGKPFREKHVLIAAEYAIFRYKKSKELIYETQFSTALFNSLSQIIIVTDCNDSIKFLNESALISLGVSELEWMDKSMAFMLSSPVLIDIEKCRFSKLPLTKMNGRLIGNIYTFDLG
jgi:CheY-like chemotaxis protein